MLDCARPLFLECEPWFCSFTAAGCLPSDSGWGVAGTWVDSGSCGTGSRTDTTTVAAVAVLADAAVGAMAETFPDKQ
jgi:hypothetical protein